MSPTSSAQLTPAQRGALESFREASKRQRDGAEQTISHVLRMANVPPQRYADALNSVKSHARVALHFHPDRLDTNLDLVATSLLRSGVYLSQFETGISNGSVSAHRGGARDLWERELYGGAYHEERVRGADRPKYGALDIFRTPDGPAPRFGSCYFVLAPTVSARCTFTYLDSYQLPIERGTMDAFEAVMAPWLAEVFTRGSSLGQGQLTAARLVDHMCDVLPQPRAPSLGRPFSRNLDHYIEAQVHGDVLLERDAERLVADASFRESEVETIFEELCNRYDVELDWHDGFSLGVADVPDDFRGNAMPSLAARVAGGDRLDTRSIGLAAQQLRREPERWADRGSFEAVLQELKMLWHVLVRFGTPAGSPHQSS